ncbi:hypothetical protein PAECIP112173_04179 [Paenibacillus sp. JJ-100]|uniref:imm11 family protein n=1 Tax=Paenibacillus sp. JJ-100 TaxID=2974896 RepID=UPI0022FF7599|nr:DUF1629 domain-containing protein [Paenibacillus sp. JJ-100]CAI6084101.1 hypothetical protein PAECIP112173_04179 [Paenibacillus sp. JJ-100]
MVQRFYELTEDHRILNPFRPPALPTSFDELPLSSVMMIERQMNEEPTDWISRPSYFVSDRMKRLMEMVDEALLFKSVTFIDQRSGEQLGYWACHIPAVLALSDNSLFYPNGSIQHLLLQGEKVRDQRMFTLEGARGSGVIVRLDLAESMLRRGLSGFVLRKVDLE